jgi:hypothetical protein
LHRFESFQPRILAARSEDGLVDIMRDFCKLWMPSDLARLPLECQSCEVRIPEDIASLAVAFRKCDLRSTDPELSHTLQVLSRAFVLASEQLGRIRPIPSQ